MARAPYWKSYPIIPRDLGNWASIPKAWLAYMESEDRAYHRVNGLTFVPRTEPRDIAALNPWHAYRVIPRTVKALHGQLDAFKEARRHNITLAPEVAAVA